MVKKVKGYTTVALPNELMEKVNILISSKTKKYKSRTEFIKKAILKRLAEN